MPTAIHAANAFALMPPSETLSSLSAPVVSVDSDAKTAMETDPITAIITAIIDAAMMKRLRAPVLVFFMVLYLLII
jgi:hypothetical protein